MTNKKIDLNDFIGVEGKLQTISQCQPCKILSKLNNARSIYRFVGVVTTQYGDIIVRYSTQGKGYGIRYDLSLVPEVYYVNVYRKNGVVVLGSLTNDAMRYDSIRNKFGSFVKQIKIEL